MDKKKGKAKMLVDEEDVAGTRSSRGRGDVASSSTGRGDVASSTNRAESSMFQSTDLNRHYCGTVSTAVMGNTNMENFSQVELGRTATYVGIYDGHGGYQAAAYVSRNMTRNLMERIRDTSTMSIDHLREAFLITETAWLDKVYKQFEINPRVAGYGTCCLVGVFWKRNLYVANVGDSRAVIGRALKDPAKIYGHQVTTDDNVNNSIVRAEVQALHSEEPDFVVEDAIVQGLYRIKGRIQVSKSIGDAYLKLSRFNLNDIDKKWKLNAPVRDNNPAVSAYPNTYLIPIEPQDRFVIFASDGLWDMMTSQEAADIVHQNPKEGIAERLVTEGLTRLAREKIHDNISVVVIFIDHTLQGTPGEMHEEFPHHSIRQGSVSSVTRFNALDSFAEDTAQKRAILLRNLPYATTLNTLYTRLWRWAPLIQTIVLGRHGFTATLIFFESQHARACINTLRNRFIMKGKLVCMSFIWEREYQNNFFRVDHQISLLELPFTVQVSNLTDQAITVEHIANFFQSLGLQLRNLPVIHRRRSNGRLYAFVTFTTIADRNTAMLRDGSLLLNDFIRIKARQ